MNNVIIGCPVKNDLLILEMMLRSLMDSTNAYDKIVIIEAGSTDGCKEFLDYLSKVNSKVEVIHSNTKTTLEAMNLLFSIAKERKSDLLITQADVIFPKLLKRDWLYEMKDIAQQEDVGAIIPYNGGRKSGPDYIDGFFWIGGWCTYITFRTIEKLGGFDENFPYGFGVDIDYTMRIINMGLKIIGTEYFVDHHMLSAREHDTNPNTEQMKKEAAEYFRRKWKLQEFAPKNLVGAL